MQAFFAQLTGLDGARAASFMTRALPFSLMGGNRTVRHLKHCFEMLGKVILPYDNMFE